MTARQHTGRASSRSIAKWRVSMPMRSPPSTAAARAGRAHGRRAALAQAGAAAARHGRLACGRPRCRTALSRARHRGHRVCRSPNSSVSRSTSRAAVLVTSQSGESAEVIAWFAETARAIADTFGLTLEPSSILGANAALADRRRRHRTCLCRDPQPHDQLCAASRRPRRAWARSEPALDMLRTRARLDVTEAVKRLKPCRAIVYFRAPPAGPGGSSGARDHGVGADACLSLEGGQFRHGPMEMLGPDGRRRAFLRRRAGDVAGRRAGRDTVAGGSPAVVFDASGADEVRGDLILRFPGQRHRRHLFDAAGGAALHVGFAGRASPMSARRCAPPRSPGGSRDARPLAVIGNVNVD